MLWGIQWDVVAPWVYFGMMPILFVPVVRWLAGQAGSIETSEDMTLASVFTLLALAVWPVWFIGAGPVYGFGQLVKFIANYERKTVERSS